MERWIGIILIVLAAWAGVEYYTKGADAFGGIFASGDAAPAGGEESWAGERAGRRLERTHAERDQYMKHALGE
jgi:hypothetical protein